MFIDFYVFLLASYFDYVHVGSRVESAGLRSDEIAREVAFALR